MTEMILFAIHNLRPIAYLIFQCVKTAIWFIVFMIAIVITTDQQRIGVERHSLGLLVLLNGLLEAVVLVYVHEPDPAALIRSSSNSVVCQISKRCITDKFTVSSM